MPLVTMGAVVNIPLASLDVLLLCDSAKMVGCNASAIAALMIYD
jgi:hypothetical protein